MGSPSRLPPCDHDECSPVECKYLKAQPAPDLEPMRRLIETAEKYLSQGSGAERRMHCSEIARQANSALPALQSLLNEVVILRASDRAQKEIIERLREAVLQTARDLHDDLTPEAILRLDSAVGVCHAAGLDEYAQLAADHDAAVRAPLEAQIAELHELLHKLWQFVNLGDCPLTTRVIKALNKTAQCAAEH